MQQADASRPQIKAICRQAHTVMDMLAKVYSQMVSPTGTPPFTLQGHAHEQAGSSVCLLDHLQHMHLRLSIPSNSQSSKLKIPRAAEHKNSIIIVNNSDYV